MGSGWNLERKIETQVYCFFDIHMEGFRRVLQIIIHEARGVMFRCGRSLQVGSSCQRGSRRRLTTWQNNDGKEVFLAWLGRRMVKANLNG